MMSDKAPCPERRDTIDGGSTESILAEFARLLRRVASEIPAESSLERQPEERLGLGLSERISARNRRS